MLGWVLLCLGVLCCDVVCCVCVWYGMGCRVWVCWDGVCSGGVNLRFVPGLCGLWFGWCLVVTCEELPSFPLVGRVSFPLFLLFVLSLRLFTFPTLGFFARFVSRVTFAVDPFRFLVQVDLSPAPGGAGWWSRVYLCPLC